MMNRSTVFAVLGVAFFGLILISAAGVGSNSEVLTARTSAGSGSSIGCAPNLSNVSQQGSVPAGSTPIPAPVPQGNYLTKLGYWDIRQSASGSGCGPATFFNMEVDALKKKRAKLTAQDAAHFWQCLLDHKVIDTAGTIPRSNISRAKDCMKKKTEAALARTQTASVLAQKATESLNFGNNGWSNTANSNIRNALSLEGGGAHTLPLAS